MARKALKWPTGKSAQDIQDGIFRKMSADEKLQLTSKMFYLIKKIEQMVINDAVVKFLLNI